MITRIAGLLTFIFIFSLSVHAQETQSDYEIQREFQNRYNQIQQSIDTVTTADSAQAIIESVKELDEEFRDQSDLLNRVLYPNTYDDEIKQLRESSTRTLERVEQRQQQTEELENLETQLSTYEDDLQQLNQRTDSLNQAMQESIESEKQLSSMVRNYRNSLEQRDELILTFIDSMVVAYQQMDLQALQNLEDIDSQSRLESDGDALRMIHTITLENMQILEENSDKLRLQDYMRMSEVQQEFQNMWNQLGAIITDVYEGEDSERLNNEINESLNQWNQTLKDQSFVALNDTLQSRGVDIGSFNSSDELYNSLNSYLNEQITRSQEDATEESYAEYQEFQDFWNRAEMQWGSNFADAGIMSAEQVGEINNKMSTWAENAQPATTNIFVYLFGAVVIIALVLGVLLVRQQQNTA